MNLKTKHILAVSAVAGIAGAIGYFIGHKVGYERAYSDIYDEEPEEIKMVEAPRTVKHILGLDEIPESIYKKYFENKDHRESLKEICEDSDEYEYYETEKGYGARTKSYMPDLTDISLPEKRARGLQGKTAEKLIWDELVNNYISDEDVEEDTDDEEDIENIRTQGEVEYTSDEPYLVDANDVLLADTNPDDVDTLSYYREDDVLVDSFDEIVLEREVIVGNIELNLIKGPVVYVRNPQTKRDYEIIIEQGSYEKEVLGADDEQYKNAVKFFKLGDE